MHIFKNQTRMIYLMGITLIAIVVLCTFLGERGLMKVMSLKRELQEVEYTNQRLREENIALEMYIDLLKHDKRSIERIAREELGLVKSDEIVYLFEQN